MKCENENLLGKQRRIIPALVDAGAVLEDSLAFAIGEGRKATAELGKGELVCGAGQVACPD